MDGLTMHHEPHGGLPTMVVAFAGWPDATESATRAVRYLIRKLSAKRFAEIDPEEFYDFTAVRPRTRKNRAGQRVIRWPSNTFYQYVPEDGSGGCTFFLGTEPSLKWRTFSKIMLSVAEQCGPELVVSLGALFAAVPHTRATHVTGTASSPELARKTEALGIVDSDYRGPTGIHSAFMDASVKNGISYAGLWGHTPHYVTTSPNPKVSYTLLTKLCSLVDLEVDLDDLRKAMETFESDVDEAISKQDDVTKYVRRLERRYDSRAPKNQFPSADAVVEELERFLRSRRTSEGREEVQE